MIASLETPEEQTPATKSGWWDEEELLTAHEEPHQMYEGEKYRLRSGFFLGPIGRYLFGLFHRCCGQPMIRYTVMLDRVCQNCGHKEVVDTGAAVAVCACCNREYSVDEPELGG